MDDVVNKGAMCSVGDCTLECLDSVPHHKLSESISNHSNTRDVMGTTQRVYGWDERDARTISG